MNKTEINTAEPILQLRDLEIGYKQKKTNLSVCKHLNAEIVAGEMVCLLGANGAGKSTLIRTISGFQPALSGQATLQQRNLFTLHAKEMALLAAVVLTERVDVPHATVEELVSLGRAPFTGYMGRLQANDKHVVEDAMCKCGIIHKRNHALAGLSDGEKQKAFIAKALAQDTPLIVLDEPTAFLDLPARVEIIQLLREIARTSGRSVLLSTHDLDLAIQMADKLWLLPDGGPLLTGSPEDLLLQNAFQHLFRESSIELDTATGLFKIKHKIQQHQIAVKGHGLEYVLLRRAFARHGVKVNAASQSEDLLIEIKKETPTRFALHQPNGTVHTETSIEEVVVQTLTHLHA